MISGVPSFHAYNKVLSLSRSVAMRLVEILAAS